MERQDQITRDIWTRMIFSRNKEMTKWKLHDFEVNNSSMSYHVHGSKYDGRIFWFSNITNNNMTFDVEFVNNDNADERILLAHITLSDILRLQKKEIPSDAIEQFKVEYGFV